MCIQHENTKILRFIFVITIRHLKKPVKILCFEYKTAFAADNEFGLRALTCIVLICSAGHNELVGAVVENAF